MVTGPAVVLVTVAVTWPKPLVVDDDGVTTTATPVLVQFTTAPETGLPPESFAVAVRVTNEVPLSGSVVPEDVSVIVEPTICMGICAGVAVPAVAVIVAVRLIGFAGEEKVTVAGVVVLVTTVGALRTPVSVFRVTVTPANAAFALFKATTVIVEEVEPSDFTVKGVAERRIEEADTVGVELPVLVMIMAFVEPVMLA